MHELKCPHCGQVFTVDATEYDSIVAQVRNSEFDDELHRRLEASKASIEAVKDAEIKAIKADAEAARAQDRAAAAKEAETARAEIARLKGELSAADTKAERKISEERDRLTKQLHEAQVEVTKAKGDSAVKVADVERREAAKREELSAKLAEAKAENVRLQDQVKLVEERGRLDKATALQAQKQESDEALRTVQRDLEQQLLETTTQLEYYKDLKARMSTKMVGETLEQHCLIQFNQLRATAFPTAYFEKDNDARSGSKGDFIYREEVDGIELLSIMFEMKNEMDTTDAKSKHKNEDFFKELDKDRNEKKCEYAILVSMLEADNELYNTGIVDVSYRYPKMYVIRPQFFIPIITVLRNAAMNAMSARRELARVRNMNLDVMQFEENLIEFKGQVSRNYDLASRRFQAAIDDIDKSIAKLQAVRQELVSSEKYLRLVNDKSSDLTIRKLTSNAPSVRALFEAASIQD